VNSKENVYIYLYKKLNLPIEEQKAEETNNLFRIAVTYGTTAAPFNTASTIQIRPPHHLNNQQSSTRTGTAHNQQDTREV
jgi:hypothetical protein